MRFPIYIALPALLALPSAGGEAPAASRLVAGVSASSMSNDEAVTPGAEAGAPSTSSASYLRVNVSCSGMQCEAVACGGSGSYVDWEWSLAEKTGFYGRVSTADATVYCVSGLVLRVSATVVDSNGAQATGGGLVFC